MYKRQGSKCASDIEIIIVNDGSKDETGAKADEWEARYPGICLLYTSRGGVRMSAWSLTGATPDQPVVADMGESDSDALSVSQAAELAARCV